MPRIAFTSNLKRLVECAETDVPGVTVRDALEAVFTEHQHLRGYIVDDQNRLRKHLAIFVDGQPVKDRAELSDPVRPNGEIYVMQALSGG